MQGTVRTEHFTARAFCSSMFTFANAIFPSLATTFSSNVGTSTVQGVHQLYKAVNKN